MTKREYLKYNNPDAFDKLGKPIKPGDTVVINSYYYSSPHIGIVDHFTQGGRLAIYWGTYHTRKNVLYGKCWAYRDPSSVIKIKNGNKNYHKNKE